MTDLWSLYGLMLKSRLFEEAVARLWRDGLISGEMHLGTGEEAIIAGIVSQLGEGDALALDHRATAALLMRGVKPAALLKEFLGRPDGLCGGMGGHMHLFSREHLAASSGIVGSSGPAAAGFALAAQHLRPGTVTVAFFGEAAMNQGMLMESMNLASVWKLPLLFVCKDDGWAITTRSEKTTGGDLLERARGLGLQAMEVDGRQVEEVRTAARSAIKQARAGRGPTFLRAACVHLEGHFLGYQLLRITRKPLKEMPAMAVPLVRSLLKPGGAALDERAAGLKSILKTVHSTRHDPRHDTTNDPLLLTRQTLLTNTARLQELENKLKQEMDQLFREVQKDKVS